jgi:hypothetical protein
MQFFYSHAEHEREAFSSQQQEQKDKKANQGTGARHVELCRADSALVH